MTNPRDYFALLELPAHFDMDMKALEASYFKQQRLFHPDRYVGKPASERQEALNRSVDINQAYHTLKNPLLRAQYLLHLHGIAIGTEQDTLRPSPSLLMETMEWREKVDECGDSAALEQYTGALHSMAEQSVTLISALAQNQQWDAMAHETLRLGYLLKTQEALVQQKKRLETHAS